MKFLSKNTLGVSLLYLTSLLVVAAVILTLLSMIGPAKAMGNQPPSERTTTGRQVVEQNNMERVSVEMELISGSMICVTYNLPIDRGPFYIEAHLGEYRVHYDVGRHRRLLRNAVIFAREVERCDFVHKGVYLR